ncbi:Protein phosphatase PP2A regulatory subunit B [Tieghemiomyces parasiticus]|uniref:Polyadenylate-binding protein n=1 Tax=Tieghemiomyces parasiticus TaxID=78921 RepID=A0A9W8ALJ0_9FUNG|nr:Protein phosphatase PP2A regulatory subunit B [Tieghemiomyces parasiticus]
MSADHAAATHTAEATPAPAGQETTPAANAAPQSASLYVGELDPSVTEAILFELFNMVGPVASIRVCRDAVTRRSLGYGYVNYHNVEDCEQAIDALNYTEIKGKPCRIMWSQRDPAIRKSGNGNIFIKNLDASIDNKALHDTFSAFGHILSCKVATIDGVSKGYGFVHFEKDESATAAINAVNGMLMNDKKVFVSHHVPRRERESKFEEQRAKFTNVYVKNLDEAVDEDQLRKLFEPFGEVTSLVIARDADGKSRGFGFVNYADHPSAFKAVEALHDSDVNDKKLFVTRAQKKSEREDELRRQYEKAKYDKLSKYQGVNLYIKNLEDEVDDDQLRQEFSVYGDITSAKVMRDEQGKPKGFGFVCFSTPEEATKAVTEMNGRMLGSKPIYVAIAQRKETRRRELEAQAAQRNQLRMQAPMGMPGAGMPAPMYNAAPHMYYNGPQGAAAAPGGYPPRAAMPGYQQPGMGAGPRTNRWNHPGAGPQGAQPQQQPQQGAYSPAQGGPNAPGQFPGVNHPGYPAGAAGGQQANQARTARGGGRQGAPRGGAAGSGRGGYQGGAPNGANRQGAKYQGPRHPGSQNAAGQGNDGEANPAAPSTTPAAEAGKNESGDASTASGADGANAETGGLTAATLANASPEDQKMLLGEALYPLIEEREADLAGKITGMLLEMDNSELLHLLEDKEARNAKVDEAIAVLQQHLKTDSA